MHARKSAPLIVSWAVLLLAILNAVLQFALPIPSTFDWERTPRLVYGVFMIVLPLVTLAGLMFALFAPDHSSGPGRTKALLLWIAVLITVVSYVGSDLAPVQAFMLMIAVVGVAYTLVTVMSIMQDRRKRSRAETATESRGDEDSQQDPQR